MATNMIKCSNCNSYEPTSYTKYIYIGEDYVNIKKYDTVWFCDDCINKLSSKNKRFSMEYIKYSDFR